MRIALLLLAQAALTAGGLWIYDTLRDAPASVADAPPAAMDPDLGDLDARLRKLEGAPAPGLQGTGPDLSEVLARLEVLEDAARHPSPETPPAADVSSDAEPTRADAEPTIEDMEHFRKLRDAAAKADRAEKERARVRKALAKTGLRLTSAQQAKVGDALAAFRPRVDAMWREMKQDAETRMQDGEELDYKELIRTTQTRIQQAFATTLEPIVAVRDAETIAQTLLPWGK